MSMVNNYDMKCISSTLGDISIQLDQITDMLIDIKKRLTRLEVKKCISHEPVTSIGTIYKPDRYLPDGEIHG